MNFDLILLDINTQRDLLVAGGRCYTPQADEARQNIYRLFDWARKNDQPVISTVLRVPPDRIGPLADVPHCIEGTDGEKKLNKTILRPYVNLGQQNTTDLDMYLFERYRQIIIEMRDTDIFAHARTERLITELSGVSFILCGAGVVGGVARAAVGLRNRGFSVALATDAVADLDDPEAEMAVSRMDAKGVALVKTGDLCVPRPRRRYGSKPLAAFREAEKARVKK